MAIMPQDSVGSLEQQQQRIMYGLDPNPIFSTSFRAPTAEELQFLNSFGLVFNQPEPAITCKQCGFALKADGDRVSRHLGEKHGCSKTIQKMAQ
jgi:hypothetical protein